MVMPNINRIRITDPATIPVRISVTKWPRTIITTR